VDPVTIGAVLAAVAGGVGGSLGSQVWAAVSALVRRPFERDHTADCAAAALSSGEAELAALDMAPADERGAVALAEVLVARANADDGFREALEAWWVQASRIRLGGDVTNTVRSGTFHGPVVQGRDFHGLTLGSSTPVPPCPPNAG
jgi:hypothetical protein